ncbi:MAG: Holliday junction resolvase RuvX [Candidatus Moranbacteria bacterium]|nr:Holliday junction resolvase RuvX [Candidatus Moranbacteria bacterium]
METSKKANASYYLGIDFGAAKAGIAIADSETRIAFSYGVLKNDKDIFRKIREIVEKEGIGTIIIGNSYNLETKLPSGNLVSKFGKLLQQKLNIPIEFQSEIYSTKLAERQLKEKGVKGVKRFDDQEAARIILQSWLDKKQ